MSKFDKIKRLMAGVSEAALSIGQHIKSRLLATVSPNAVRQQSATVLNGAAVPTERTPMQVIMADRDDLKAQIEAAAKCGYVPDGLALSLLANHEDELAERRRLLTEVVHQLQACLRRLAAMAPPPKPEPEPRPEPRKRRFSKPSDWFPNGAAGLAK